MFKVLVVDDEKLVREGVAETFRETGRIEVFTARNGDEALDTLREAAIDGMVLDIKMPSKDGFKVLEAIPLGDGPAPVMVVLSGYDDFSFAQRAIPFGIAEYILKPISPAKVAELAGRMIGLMERRRAGREGPTAAPGPDAAPGPGTPLADLIVRYVEEHLSEDISNEILSSFFHYSQNYLGQVFKRDKEVSISEFVTQKRIDEAKRILREEYLNVSEVAYRVGFKDNHYFCTVFKKLTGLTPKEYRVSVSRPSR
jgi:two-component system response regulator YesN